MHLDAPTIALVLAVAAAIGTVASLLGASPALAAYPRVAAFLRLVAALIPDLRAALLALSPAAAVAAASATIMAAKKAPKTPPLPLLFLYAFAIGLVTLAGFASAGAIVLGVTACASAGPIASSVASVACAILVPLLVAVPGGSVIAGTICEALLPTIGPIVTAVVNAASPDKRARWSARAAVSASYKPLRVNGAQVGSLDAEIVAEGAAQGAWTVDPDGAANCTYKDAGK